MTHARIIQGSKDVLTNFLSNLQGHARMMQIVSDEEELEPKVEKGERIRLGMFPELLVITDECFNAAEWQGEEKF